MSQTKAINANPVKNNNSSCLGAGSADSSLMNSITVAQNGDQRGNINPTVNDGVVFGGNTTSGPLTSITLTQKATRQHNISRWSGYDRIDVSIDLESGDVTSGSNNGTTILPSGMNGITGFFADASLHPHYTYALGNVPINVVFDTRERTYPAVHAIVARTGSDSFSFSGTAALIGV